MVKWNGVESDISDDIDIRACIQRFVNNVSYYCMIMRCTWNDQSDGYTQSLLCTRHSGHIEITKMSNDDKTLYSWTWISGELDEVKTDEFQCTAIYIGNDTIIPKISFFKNIHKTFNTDAPAIDDIKDVILDCCWYDICINNNVYGISCRAWVTNITN